MCCCSAIFTCALTDLIISMPLLSWLAATIINCSLLQYKKEAPRVEALLKRKGWKAAAIHGDISQAQRTAAVEAFKAGTCPLLIATDVAARGLDIPGNCCKSRLGLRGIHRCVSRVVMQRGGAIAKQQLHVYMRSDNPYCSTGSLTCVGTAVSKATVCAAL